MSCLKLESSALAVTVNPDVGGTITEVRHKSTGLSVLGGVGWDSVDAPLPSFAARDEAEWLTRYTGGWPLLFPNAGDACVVDGTFHGFHGEASVAPWEAELSGSTLVMSRSFTAIAASMRRTLDVDGELLSIREELTYTGAAPIGVMWGHHPTFGGDLLAAPFEITSAAGRVVAEPLYDPPANPIASDASGTWPVLPSKSGGSVDLSRPQAPWSSVAYLTDFAAPWAAIRRLDDAIAACLTWDGRRFPCAWIWYELGGTLEAPWNGFTHLIGIEPNTTPCALGLAQARVGGAPLLRLDPGARLEAEIALHVFKPAGPITAPRHIFAPQQARAS